MIRRAEYDGKADVWAIGVITYILLGGIPPFDEPPELAETPQGTEAMFKDILAVSWQVLFFNINLVYA